MQSWCRIFRGMRTTLKQLTCVGLAATCLLVMAGCPGDKPKDDRESTKVPAAARFLPGGSDLNGNPTPSHPDQIAMSMVLAKRDEGREGVRAEYVDQWIAEPGWTGTVEKATQEDGHTYLWIRQSNSMVSGGFYWVVADVPRNAKGATMRSVVTYTGRIGEIQYISVGAVPELRIVVRNVTVHTVDGK
jgi:hypothetical protein